MCIRPSSRYTADTHASLVSAVTDGSYGLIQESIRATSSSGRCRTHDKEAGETLVANIGAVVKAIILDDNGFWKPLTQILHIAMTLIKLLRMVDSNKPAGPEPHVTLRSFA